MLVKIAGPDLWISPETLVVLNVHIRLSLQNNNSGVHLVHRQLAINELGHWSARQRNWTSMQKTSAGTDIWARMFYVQRDVRIWKTKASTTVVWPMSWKPTSVNQYNKTIFEIIALVRTILWLLSNSIIRKYGNHDTLKKNLDRRYKEINHCPDWHYTLVYRPLVIQTTTINDLPGRNQQWKWTTWSSWLQGTKGPKILRRTTAFWQKKPRLQQRFSG